MLNLADGTALKIALLGNTGLLGAQFQEYFASRLQPVDVFNRSNFDIAAPLGALDAVLGKFDVVINCIAYTAVDRAESEFDLATMANTTLPANLAELSAEKGFRLVHFSTDYVFDGESLKPYRTHDAKNPQSVYGRTKSLGEDLVEASDANYSIFRTSWLYGQFGKCFPKTIAHLLTTKNDVQVVDDQVGQPTWTQDVARLVMHHIESGSPEKMIHATSTGKTSWFEFARQIGRSMGPEFESKLTPTSSLSFPTAAQRPSFSVLSHLDSKLECIGEWSSRWQEASGQVLESVNPRAN